MAIPLDVFLHVSVFCWGYVSPPLSFPRRFAAWGFRKVPEPKGSEKPRCPQNRLAIRLACRAHPYLKSLSFEDF